MHWSAPLIGKPYEAGASGPESFDCIGLVRYYFRARHSIELPDYKIEEGFAALLAFARATGWRPVEGLQQEDDLMLMDGLEGKHVGVVIYANQALGLLHAQGNNKKGSVVWQPLSTLNLYRNFESWRHV